MSGAQWKKTPNGKWVPTTPPPVPPRNGGLTPAPTPQIRGPLNEYTRLLWDRPLDLFRKYAVSPPDAAVGDEVVDALGSLRRNRVMPLSSRSQITTQGSFRSLFRRDMGPMGEEGFMRSVVGRKIAWINLDWDTSRHGALTFQAIIPGSNDTIPAGHVPVWFLPWESRNLVELTIPPRQNDDDDDPDDPKLFFTAGINGCSVFVRGDPASPTVTHAGISQGQTPYGNSPSDFWRDLLVASLCEQNDLRKTWEVNNTDYINQTGVSGGAQTAHTDAYLRWLKTLPSGPITVSHVVPWGCVFGVRYGRLWSFYLQENAVVYTYKIVAQYSREEVTETKKVFGVFNKEVTRDVSVRKLVRLENTVNRPVVLRDFFPGKGGGVVNFIDKWQKW